MTRNLVIARIELPWSVGPLPDYLAFHDLANMPEAHSCALSCWLAQAQKFGRGESAYANYGISHYHFKFECTLCGSVFQAEMIVPESQAGPADIYPKSLSLLLSLAGQRIPISPDIMAACFPQLKIQKAN